MDKPTTKLIEVVQLPLNRVEFYALMNLSTFGLLSLSPPHPERLRSAAACRRYLGELRPSGWTDLVQRCGRLGAAAFSGTVTIPMATIEIMVDDWPNATISKIIKFPSDPPP